MIYKVLTRTNIRIMETQKNGFDTGIASEYLVLSILYRLGFEAYMTMGNKKSVDIWIMREDGADISIDVKSVRSSDSIPVGNVKVKNNHYVVFVIYNNKFDLGYRIDDNDKMIFEEPTLPDFYIVPSKDVLEKRTKYELKAGGERYNIFKKDIKDYKNSWEQLELSKISVKVAHSETTIE